MNLWNSLPQSAVDAGTVSKFKEELERFLIGNGLKGYEGESRKMGMRSISAMIEWRSGLDGPSGLILLLCLTVLWS